MENADVKGLGKPSSFSDYWEKSSNYSKLTEALDNTIQNIRGFMTEIECGAVYQAVENEIKFLTKRKYGEREARQLAWVNRRYMVARMLKLNRKWLESNEDDISH